MALSYGVQYLISFINRDTMKVPPDLLQEASPPLVVQAPGGSNDQTSAVISPMLVSRPLPQVSQVTR